MPYVSGHAQQELKESRERVEEVVVDKAAAEEGRRQAGLQTFGDACTELGRRAVADAPHAERRLAAVLRQSLS